MRNARIFLVEDNLQLVDILCELLSVMGHHEVVIRTSTLKGALAIIESGQLQSGGINLAIVDENFPETNGELEEILGGPIVAEAIKKNDANIIIIAFSGDERNERNKSLYDDYVYKGDGIAPLLRAISSL
jgi:CheY-like chemotaxis protein